MKMLHRGQKGFTLIELLVVIAILGIIAAVVALNVGTFFGRGTLQAANTELHQAQTAIISAMAEGGTAKLTTYGAWDGSPDVVTVYVEATNTTYDAANYVYGLFKATYTVEEDGSISNGDPGGWGDGIEWDGTAGNWKLAGT